MIMRYADPFDTLFAFQQALENRQLSDWLGTSTAGMGSYPPINVFQQGDDLVAIIELPGVNKADLNIQAKQDTIRISGRKSIDYPEDVSLHRRERLSGAFDRTSERWTRRKRPHGRCAPSYPTPTFSRPRTP